MVSKSSIHKKNSKTAKKNKNFPSKSKKTVKKPKKRVLKNKPVSGKSAVKKSKSNRKIKKSLPLPQEKLKIKKSGEADGMLIGLITHYFPHVQAAVIKLKKPLAKGDEVKIKGHTTDFIQTVISMQIDRKEILNAKKGDEIGLRVSSRVRQGDKAYKL